MKEIEWIALEHMSVGIDTERLLVDDYSGQERDLCLYLVQAYFCQIVEENTGGGAELNRHGQEKALSLAKWQAMRRLSSEKDGLAGLVERGKFFMLNDAENTGWHHSLEYDDVAELLASILEGKEGMDEAYDWKFIVEQLIPASEQAKIPASIVSLAATNIKKMRGLVPAARELLERQKTNIISPEETEATLHNWLFKVVDTNTTYEGLKEELNQWRGLSVERTEPIIGYQIILPNGNTMIAIETNGGREISIIEQALKNRVELRTTGYDWLIQKVGLLKPDILKG